MCQCCKHLVLVTHKAAGYACACGAQRHSSPTRTPLPLQPLPRNEAPQQPSLRPAPRM